MEPGPRFAARDGLRVLDFGDDAVVFDPLSWDAHLLNPAALAVLDLLMQAPRGLSDIESFLRDALRPEDRADAAAHAQRLLADLQTLGLAQPITGEPDALC